MNKLDCDIVKDILPSYVEGLTSEMSNAAVQAHVAQCTACGALLMRMREEAQSPPQKQQDTAQIDYLKKIKRRVRNAKIIGFGALGLVVACLLCVFVQLTLIGSPCEMMGYSNNVYTHYDAQSDTVTVFGNVDGYVSHVSVKESARHPGHVEMRVYTVDSPLFFRSREFYQSIPVFDHQSIDWRGEYETVGVFAECDTRAYLFTVQGGKYLSDKVFASRETLPEVLYLFAQATPVADGQGYVHGMPQSEDYLEIYIPQNPNKRIWRPEDEGYDLLDDAYVDTTFVFEQGGQRVISQYGQPLRTLSQAQWAQLDGYVAAALERDVYLGASA